MRACTRAENLGHLRARPRPLGAVGVSTAPAPARPVPRELFPLPLVQTVGGELPLFSRKVHQRLRRRGRRASLANQAIHALNEAYGHAAPSTAPLSAAQLASQRAILSSIASVPDEALVYPTREAIDELLGTAHAYDGDGAPSRVRRYDPALVSLPEVGACVPQALDLLDERAAGVLRNFESALLRSDDDWGLVCEREGPIRPYMDEALRNDPDAYFSFVLRLARCGMVAWTTQPRDLVVPFFVEKKDGRQRLVWDCRVANRRFVAGGKVRIASGAKWADLRLREDEQLHIGQCDVKNYFYALGIPEAVGRFFCLPPIAASALERAGLGLPACGAGEGGRVWPFLRVCPMGWSWAFWIGQRVLQRQLELCSGLPLTRHLADHEPAPPLTSEQPVIIAYCDNVNIVGLAPAAVDLCLKKVIGHLEDCGFAVHDIQFAAQHVTSLGYEIDGELCMVRPKAERVALLRGASAWLAQRPRVTAPLLQRYLGHLMHVLLLRREMLSLLRNLYDFAAQPPGPPRRLWASAAREAARIAALLPLCVASMRLPFSELVTVSDACPTGFAVCQKRAMPALARSAADRSERSRYRGRDPGVRARASALEGSDVFSDVNTVLPTGAIPVPDDYETNPDFEEIPCSLWENGWTTVVACPYKNVEDIGTLELRAVLVAVRHTLRVAGNFGKRILHLGDNLSVTLGLCKSRFRNFTQMSLMRRIMCLSLATNCSFHHRWVPSERNAADAGSRRWELAAPAPRALKKAPAPAGALHDLGRTRNSAGGSALAAAGPGSPGALAAHAAPGAPPRPHAPRDRVHEAADDLGDLPLCTGGLHGARPDD